MQTLNFLNVLKKHPKKNKQELIKILDDESIQLFSVVLFNILNHPMLIKSVDLRRRKYKDIKNLKGCKDKIRKLLKTKSSKTIRSTLVQSGDGIITSILSLAIFDQVFNFIKC